MISFYIPVRYERSEMIDEELIRVCQQAHLIGDETPDQKAVIDGILSAVATGRLVPVGHLPRPAPKPAAEEDVPF